MFDWRSAALCLICGLFHLQVVQMLVDQDNRTETFDDLRFTVEPQSTMAPPFTEVVLLCQAVSDGRFTMRWMFNGASVMSKSGVTVDGGMLTIPSFRNHHQGSYHCVASNSFGAIRSKDANLTRAGILRQEGELPDRTIETTVLNVAVIPCVLPKSLPPAVMQFEFNGLKLEFSDRHMVLPSGNLQIKAVEFSDQGTYKCLSVNELSGERVPASNLVTLRVINETRHDVAPRFTWTPLTNIEVIRGQTAILECAAEGWPVPVIKWTRYGGQLSVERHSQTLGNLYIRNVEKSDEGTYICGAENRNGNLQANAVYVDVLEPPSVRVPEVEQVVVEGVATSITCHVTGTPRPAVTWLHNARSIFPDQYITIVNNSLRFGSVQLFHSGFYQSLAVNSVGESYGVASLVVRRAYDSVTSMGQVGDSVQKVAPPVARQASPQEFKTKKTATGSKDSRRKPTRRSSPRPRLFPVKNRKGQGRRVGIPADEVVDRKMSDKVPTNVERTLMVPPAKPKVTKNSDSSVLLEWIAPQDGGLRVTFLKVQFKEVTGDRQRPDLWQTIDEDLLPETKSFIVGKLKLGCTYQFRLLAVYSNNDNRQGPNSGRFTLESRRPQTLTTAPVIVEVLPQSTSNISVKWQYMPSRRSAIDGFYIFFKPYEDLMDYTRLDVPGSKARSIVLTGLEEDTMYSIRMKCYNSESQSDFSNTAVKKTLARSEIAGNSSDDVVKIMFNRSKLRYEVTSASGVIDSDKQPSMSKGGGSQNSDTLLIILGIFAGFVSICLLVIGVVCMKKQLRQRRLLAELRDSGKCTNHIVTMVNQVKQSHESELLRRNGTMPTSCGNSVRRGEIADQSDFTGELSLMSRDEQGCLDQFVHGRHLLWPSLAVSDVHLSDHAGSPSPPIYFYSPLKINLCCSEALANSGHIPPYVGPCRCYPRLQSQCALHHEDYGDGCRRHICQSSDVALADHYAVPHGGAHDIRRVDPDERHSCEKSRTGPSCPTSDRSSGCSGNPVYNFVDSSQGNLPSSFADETRQHPVDVPDRCPSVPGDGVRLNHRTYKSSRSDDSCSPCNCRYNPRDSTAHRIQNDCNS